MKARITRAGTATTGKKAGSAALLLLLNGVVAWVSGLAYEQGRKHGKALDKVSPADFKPILLRRLRSLRGQDDEPVADLKDHGGPGFSFSSPSGSRKDT